MTHNIDMERLQTCFPEWQADIAQLLDQHPEFRELCRDYGDVADKLEHWEQHLKHSETVVHEWRALLQVLETEIVERVRAPFIEQGATKRTIQEPDHDSEDGW